MTYFRMDNREHLFWLIDLPDSFFKSISSEYVTIYRSILKFIYWPIYVSLILTDIWIFSKNHISTDICRNFSFFDRYMKIFKIRFWAYIDRNFWWLTYIGQYTFNIDRYMLTYSDHILFYISVVIRPYIYRANISPKLKSLKYYIYWPIYVMVL